MHTQKPTADTSCMNQVATFTTPPGNTYYNWNFENEAPNLNLTALPTQVNIIQGAFLSNPSYIAMSKDGESYYSFIVNYNSNHLIRLDYGTSPFNTPTGVDLGAFGTGGMITSHSVLYDEVSHNWFLVAVANSQLIRLALGSALSKLKMNFNGDITNTPVATVWVLMSAAHTPGLITFTYDKVVYAMKIRTVSHAVGRMAMFTYPTATVSGYGSNTQS